MLSETNPARPGCHPAGAVLRSIAVRAGAAIGLIGLAVMAGWDWGVPAADIGAP